VSGTAGSDIGQVRKLEIQNPESSMTSRKRVPAFVLLCAVSIAFWWHSLALTFRLSLTDDAYTHILLVLPLALALIYFDSKTLRLELPLNWYMGAALLVLALAAGCYARWGMVSTPGLIPLSVGMFALVIWWLSSVLLCFGLSTFSAFLFPLCFLFLIVPIPEFVLSRIVEFLQQESAVAARLMFRLIGVPATQDGIMVSIPGLDIEVAHECSSIRSSLMLIVTSMVLAHLFLRSWWRKALLIAAAVPLSVAKNGLRIFTIAELGTRVDPAFLTGKLHHHGGILFFGISVAAVGLLLWLLGKSEARTPKSP